MRRATFTWTIATLLLLWGMWGRSATAEASEHLFENDAPLAVTLFAPFREIARDDAEVQEERDGVLEFADRAGSHEIPIRVRARGKSRREPGHCSFPPLRLNLPKKEVEGTLFGGQNKLKLVTHCRDGASFQQYVLREFLVYRVYNLLTDASFRVRLLNLSYVDTGRRDKRIDRVGFVIEHKRELAKRLAMELVEVDELDSARLAPAETGLLELFQFFVSNVDFSLVAAPEGSACCHNTVLLRRDDGLVVPVPYDFDATGFVSPPYAQPLQMLDQRSVRDRRYRGFCRPGQYLDDAVAAVRRARAAIDAEIDGLEPLNDRHRGQVHRLVDDFYTILDDPEAFAEQVVDACR